MHMNAPYQTARRSSTIASSQSIRHGAELDDTFAGVICDRGLLTIAGFGSLLSETSARSTFPDLLDFRLGEVQGFRRVFAHACDIFFDRGIARMETMEMSSLSVEEHPESSIIVSLFEVEATPESIQAFIQREHEFRFVAVQPKSLDKEASAPERMAVICARNTDEAYRRRRCPPDEWERRYGRHGLDRIWRDDVLPCRVYLRHCALAAEKLGPAAHRSFLEGSVLADRKTTVGEWIQRNPSIMEELPPASLVGRYSG